jgi:uncharacterized membrane protein
MEEIAKSITIYISHGLEIIAAVVIAFAILRLIYNYYNSQFQWKSQKPPYRGGLEGLRVQFGSAVAVSLELLLGADVLATAVAPSWDEIGKLAAIATIRTVLNFFLEKELSHGLHSEKHSKSPG